MGNSRRRGSLVLKRHGRGKLVLSIISVVLVFTVLYLIEPDQDVRSELLSEAQARFPTAYSEEREFVEYLIGELHPYVLDESRERRQLNMRATRTTFNRTTYLSRMQTPRLYNRSPLCTSTHMHRNHSPHNTLTLSAHPPRSPCHPVEHPEREGAFEFHSGYRKS